MIGLKDFLRALPSLTPAERARLRAAIAALDQLTGSGNGISDRPEPIAKRNVNRLVELVAETLKSFGIETGGFPILRTSINARFRLQAEAVWAFVEQHHPERVYQERLIQRGIGMLLGSMTAQNVPISGRTVLKRILEIQGLLRDRLPGPYAFRSLGALVDDELAEKKTNQDGYYDEARRQHPEIMKRVREESRRGDQA